MGGGSGSSLGDDSGSSGFIIAGYMDLEDDTASGKGHERDDSSENSEQQNSAQEHPTAINTAQNSLPPDDSATKPEPEPSIERHLEAVPIPTPSVTPKRSEKALKSSEKQSVAIDKRQTPKAAPPPSDKADTSSHSSASVPPGDRALPAENGVRAGKGSMEGNGQGQRADGNAVASTTGGGSGASGVEYTLDMVDKKPRVLKRGPVPYPESARRNGLTGDVVLRFLLNEKGDISHLQVIHADPPDIFNDSALAAIRKWKFSPAVKDGKSVPVWVDLPMHFSLR